MRADGKDKAGGVEGPMISLEGHIGPEVIDMNGHMNVSGYDRVFDAGENAFFLSLGMGAPMVARTGDSIFRLEKFVRYEHEMLEGQPYQVRSWLIGTDGRKIQHFHELWDVTHNRRSAFFDCLAIHVSLSRRKSAMIADPELLARIKGLAAAQARFGLPQGWIARGGRP